jgi:hypothetical protein
MWSNKKEMQKRKKRNAEGLKLKAARKRLNAKTELFTRDF